MTTIAYNHKYKQVAYDGRCTGGDVIKCDDGDKLDTKGDLTFILAGALDEKEHLIGQYPNKLEKTVSVSGFLIKDKIVYGICGDDLNIAEWKMNYSDSHGSGAKFAIAAMDHGKTAKEAVEYAMTRDIYTGGKVRVFDVK